jgi:hypothetical protein
LASLNLVLDLVRILLYSLNKSWVILVHLLSIDDLERLLTLKALVLVNKDLILTPGDVELLSWRHLNFLNWLNPLLTRLRVHLLRADLALRNQLLPPTRLLKLIITRLILIDSHVYLTVDDILFRRCLYAIISFLLPDHTPIYLVIYEPSLQLVLLLLLRLLLLLLYALGVLLLYLLLQVVC